MLSLFARALLYTPRKMLRLSSRSYTPRHAHVKVLLTTEATPPPSPLPPCSLRMYPGSSPGGITSRLWTRLEQQLVSIPSRTPRQRIMQPQRRVYFRPLQSPLPPPPRWNLTPLPTVNLSRRACSALTSRRRSIYLPGSSIVALPEAAAERQLTAAIRVTTATSPFSGRPSSSLAKRSRCLLYRTPNPEPCRRASHRT